MADVAVVDKPLATPAADDYVITIVDGAVRRSTVSETAAAGIAASDVPSDIDALQAANTALDGRLDTAESTITSHGSTLTSQGSRLTTAESDIDALQTADTALDGRLDAAEADIDVLQAATNYAGLLGRIGQDGHTANMAGYYNDGDGGGGQFVWDAASTETHNSGTIINPTGNTTGRWKLIVTGRVSAKVFGAKGDGSTNDTAALKRFFDWCVSTKNGGHIPAGNYIVTAGQLVFNNGHIATAWPSITTDGHEGVKFLRADATDAPLITITSGTSVDGTDAPWTGGELGGITFDQNNKATASSQHGLSLHGITACKFGWMRGRYLGGSCVYIPQALYSGYNPDPYAVFFCEFQGVEGSYCKRYVLENRNYVGYSSNTINAINGALCELGGFFGLGAGNLVKSASLGGCAGWAFDDGAASDVAGGAPSRFTLQAAEIDDCENGFRINRLTSSKISGVRFVHRYNGSDLNTADAYWPRKCIDLGGGASPSTSNNEINITHRIESGGEKSDLGVFVDGNNTGNQTLNDISVDVVNNAFGTFTILNSDLYDNISSASQIKITAPKAIIYDSYIKPGFIARASTSNTIGASGYADTPSKIVFGTSVYNSGSHYDTSTGIFTVPYSGLYRVYARICFAVPAGTLVRMGILVNNSSLALNKNAYAVGSSVDEHYTLDGVAEFSAGDAICLTATQGGTTVNFTTPISASVDLVFSVFPL